VDAAKFKNLANVLEKKRKKKENSSSKIRHKYENRNPEI
jgi:hypothetical protein